MSESRYRALAEYNAALNEVDRRMGSLPDFATTSAAYEAVTVPPTSDPAVESEIASSRASRMVGLALATDQPTPVCLEWFDRVPRTPAGIAGGWGLTALALARVLIDRGDGAQVRHILRQLLDAASISPDQVDRDPAFIGLAQSFLAEADSNSSDHSA